MFCGHEELIGPQARLLQAGVDEPLVDRLEDVRLDDPRVDDLVDLVLEVADFLGAFVFDRHEADPLRRPGDRLGPAGAGRHDVRRRRGMARQQAADGFVDQRLEGLGSGRVAADHLLVAGLDALWHIACRGSR